MAFSFGSTAAATPFGGGTSAFGQASTPAFGAAASGSLFGAASTPAFGAAPASGSGFSFGGTSAPASSSSLFGASTPAFGSAATPFGGGVSTPAFSFSTASPAATTAPGLFGAASSGAASTSFSFASTTPSLFGASSTPSLFGAASTPSLFGGTSTPSLFGGGAAPPLFGQQQQQQSAAASALVTKEGRPITHSTKWDDLSPQAQQYLLELEKVVVQYREECKQLDADPRLGGGAAAAAARQEEEGAARAMRQVIASLGGEIQADLEQVSQLREVVMHLHRATESAVYTFKRSHAWREAAKAAAAGGSAQAVAPLDYLAGPVVLPSQFLRDSIAGFCEKLRQHKAVVAELEEVLGRGGHGTASANDPAHMLLALQGSLCNVHDALIHTAAKLQALDDKVAAARQACLARRRAAGDTSDPFAELERDEQRRREGTTKKPTLSALAYIAAGQQQQQQQQQASGAAAGTPGGTPFMASPAATGWGLFGTVPPAGFGTPLFGSPAQAFGARTGSSRKPGSRKR